jgi:hypothetical protein
MKTNQAHFILLLSLALFTIVGCGKKPDGTKSSGNVSLTKESPDIVVAGIQWSHPGRWTKLPPRQMRAVTYSIPTASGDAEPGECAVFYFGSQQGGDIQSNIDRWVSQFENPSAPQQSTKKIREINATLVSVTGNYLAPSGPMMESSGKKENYKLLGAIIEAPQGNVFFKFTATAKTAEAAESEFHAMIESITK